jgi:hypothetical protein
VTGLRYNLRGRILFRLVDLPPFLSILPKPRINRFWSGGIGLWATLRDTGTPDEQTTRDRPELVSTCLARRGRVRCPHIPMSSTPGMAPGNQAIDAPWTACDAEAAAIDNWLRQNVYHAAQGVHPLPAAPATSPSPERGQLRQSQSTGGQPAPQCKSATCARSSRCKEGRARPACGKGQTPTPRCGKGAPQQPRGWEH